MINKKLIKKIEEKNNNKKNKNQRNKFNIINK
jgi:hypothetical protein